MANRFKLSLFLFAVVQFLNAQEEPFYKGYDWDKTPSYSIGKADSDKDIIGVKDLIVTQFYYKKDHSLTEYRLEHHVIWLNSDEKIEEHNRVYLPYKSSSKLLVDKARVINKAGKTIELDADDILTAKDEETGRQYKYFAFKGIGKGSFIEYFYVVQKEPDYRGRRVTFQTGYKRENVGFDLYSPKNLVFDFKSYNGLPEVEFDTINKSENLHWQLKAKVVDGLDDEPSSAYEAQKEFLIYKLNKNLANNTSGISSYDLVSQNIFSFLYPEDRSRRTKRDLEKYMADMGLNGDEAHKIRGVENYIKANTYISNGSESSLTDLDEILKNNVASNQGIMKLYTAIFLALDIEHEVVITSDRMELAFDKNFESNNFLKEFLIYFPNEGAYLSPTNLGSRFGFPPSGLTDTYGLFIKKVKVGDFESGVGKIKYIDPVPAEKNVESIFVDLSFDPSDLTECLVEFKRVFYGYYAMFIQPYMDKIKNDSRDELIQRQAESLSENIDITDKKIVNGDPALFGIKPLEFDIDFQSRDFVEKAGNKYLFKVGKLIGKQSQLYQKKKRVLPLEDDFQRKYDRTLTIHIPKGYEIANPDDLDLAEKFNKNGKELMGFKSTHTIDGNLLKIQVDEHYSTNKVSAEEFENYRKVINTAADFNKVSLILQPKS